MQPFDAVPRVWSGQGVPADGNTYQVGRQNQGENLMCPHSLLYEDLFGDLPAASREAFQAIAIRRPYPAGVQLFVRGQAASGIFIVLTGRVNLSECLTQGKPLSSRIAGPGEILGVAATVSGDCHQLEAQTLVPSEIGFIDREDLMYFLRVNGAAAFRLVQLLSHRLDAALEHARLLPPFEGV
jgi:CRP/FNR family cyclic AMP-dependent transcriptional regulator